MGQIVTMLISVAGALAVTAVLFIGADRTVDAALTRWPAFMAGIGAVLGLIAGAILPAQRLDPPRPGHRRAVQRGMAGDRGRRHCRGGAGDGRGTGVDPRAGPAHPPGGRAETVGLRGPRPAIRHRGPGHPRLSHPVPVVQERHPGPRARIHLPVLRGDLHRPELLLRPRLELDLHQPPLHRRLGRRRGGRDCRLGQRLPDRRRAAEGQAGPEGPCESWAARQRCS